MRSIIELELLGLSTYLVETRLMGDNLSRLNKSAISYKWLVCIKWWVNKESQSLSLMLKLLVIIMTLFRSALVSLRYFKAD